MSLKDGVLLVFGEIVSVPVSNSTVATHPRQLTQTQIHITWPHQYVELLSIAHREMLGMSQAGYVLIYICEFQACSFILCPFGTLVLCILRIG